MILQIIEKVLGEEHKQVIMDISQHTLEESVESVRSYETCNGSTGFSIYPSTLTIV